jgi:hypothetical protein
MALKVHYGSPIVQGVTPYTSTKIVTPGAIADWPPYLDMNRLERYEEYTALVENRAVDVFERLDLSPGQESTITLALALPELLTNVWADALYGENSPDISFDSDDVTDQWEQLWTSNGGDDVLGWEAIFSAAFAGTGVLKLWRDDDGNVKVEEIDPAIFFPRLKAGSARDIESVTLAWEEDRKDGDRSDYWQVREDYSVVGNNLQIEYRERRKGTTEFRLVEENGSITEDVPFLPFVDTHAKRWRGRYWGISELARNMSLFDEIDATLSNIAEVLEYHGKPILQVPRSWMFGGILSKGADRAYGVNRPEEAQVARYITYDGQVTAATEHLDKLIARALLVSEVNETYFGKTEGSADSGVALRLRLQNYLKKVGRWARKDDLRIEQLANKGLYLMGVTDEAARKPSIQRGSPLPIDELQESQIAQGLVTGRLMSRETALRRLRMVDPDEIDDELDRIDADGVTSPGGGAGLPPPAPPPPPAGLLGNIARVQGLEPPSAAGGADQRALS